jgi:hypothetical protein
LGPRAAEVKLCHADDGVLLRLSRRARAHGQRDREDDLRGPVSGQEEDSTANLGLSNQALSAKKRIYPGKRGASAPYMIPQSWALSLWQ